MKYFNRIFAATMGQYNFTEIESKWQKRWAEMELYKTENSSDKPKFYALDMFPYPSGAGLHVGHPLGYIASDIVARYKRLNGFNVLHPMGYDSFGLPAEQYAIQTGQHPKITTENNVARFREQLDKMGFCFDWSREVRTSDPNFYKWTQWIFSQLFENYYDLTNNKATRIDALIKSFEENGNLNVHAHTTNKEVFTAQIWNQKNAREKEDTLNQYRLAFVAETTVNWCQELGTVLANEEVVNGVSERGGYPVIRKKMKQWSLRITAYAERLLEGLNRIEWSESIKEIQRNWIGRSEGVELDLGLINTELITNQALMENTANSPSPLQKGLEEELSVDENTNPLLKANITNSPSPLEKGLGEEVKTPLYKTANHYTYKNLKVYPRLNRKNATPQEALLWQELRGDKLGSKFRRQHIIGNFIVDFVCLSKKLIIEVDGGIHKFQKSEDKLRQEILEAKGYVVIRFWNEEVEKNIGEVILQIKRILNDLTPNPSRMERGMAADEVYLNNSIITTEFTNKLQTDNSPKPKFHQERMTGEELSADENTNPLLKVNITNSPSALQKGLEKEVRPNASIRVFTTRPDTIFGATFVVLAPEFEGLEDICSAEQLSSVREYIEKSKSRSEIERMADTKKTGVFTGSFAYNPYSEMGMPIWVSDYVLAGYGTGAIMGVPAHDERDFDFAQTFNLEIIPVIKPVNEELELPLTQAFSAKEGVCFNSDFLDGLTVKEAIQKAIEQMEDDDIGIGKINYKLREAGFGRQRYWGEPFPVTFDENNIPKLITELPVELPDVEIYKPTGNGESPLASVTSWVNTSNGKRETDTMPGWAGSSWYFLRYIDPNNNDAIANTEALNYWNQVDLYVGGSEHATGHLLYSRFWTKFLFDIGIISWDEPFKKLVNQGMIGGEDGQKMSKRWGNVVNPDDICEQYGADTLRLYEMFLGPLTDSKPWNTQGIEGSFRFLNKFWRLFFSAENFNVSEVDPTKEELKILHKTIKKITDDINNMSFNTAVSAFMVCVNELQSLQCNKRKILEPLCILLAPFAPHITAEIWEKLGNSNSIHIAIWPQFESNYVQENSFSYPISINGKTRTSIEFALDLETAEIEKQVLQNEIVIKWLEGKQPKKVIVVKNRIVNVVV